MRLKGSAGWGFARPAGEGPERGTGEGEAAEPTQFAISSSDTCTLTS